MKNKKTKDDFILGAKKVHGDKYDYSKVDYTNCSTKVTIICPIHGEFRQTPNVHLNGHGCPVCGGSMKKDKETFIGESNKIHGDKYDYSKVNYINCQTKVCVICHEKDEFGNEHGEFWQAPSDHIRGRGCPKCAKCNKLTNEEFKAKAKLIHGEKYDYSIINYVNSKTKIDIICPSHGIFRQKPNDHLNGFGCPKCFAERFSMERRMDTNEFIKKAREVHGEKYDYSKVVYKGTYEKVSIMCPIHGIFKQSPHVHLGGSGCPKCKQSKLEEYIEELLSSNGIEFIRQMKFPWLGLKRLDFYLPKYNVGIECQGRQHFEEIGIFGGEDGFKERQRLDEEKLGECTDNGVKVFYFSDEGFDEFQGEVVWHDAEKMVDEIVENG